MKPTKMPIGRLLAQTAKKAARAFDDALSSEGGSQAVWLILMTLMRDGQQAQSDLAAAVGIQGPTLTHHLNAMESKGLLTRTRMADNRRAHIVELTASGREMFHRLRGVAQAHDARLRDGIGQGDLDQLQHLLQALSDNLERPLPALAGRRD
ncbi:MAG: MarR family winged helix-turn-helix transcriptional regulator [Paracoccaceae bacterium]